MATPLPAPGWYPDPNTALLGAPPVEAFATPPQDDPPYTYRGSKPLAEHAPGDVLDWRSIQYHILGIPTVLKTTQLLYRSTSQTGHPTANVTSVIQPVGRRTSKVVSYQSAYDSLDRNHQPSFAISGGLNLGGLVPNVELTVFGLFLAQGCPVIVPATERHPPAFAPRP